jgi:hypothetical protein
MTVRWMAPIALLLALAGCVDPEYPLWNPDQDATGSSTTGPGGQPLTTPGQPQKRPTLDYGSRRWLGGEPTTYQRPAGSPAVEGTDSNPVLAPRDPNNPYSASGGGYTRQGTTIIGPTGDSYSIVGSTVFGPNGRPCSVVGTSLFCN